ncbi:MAG: efflux RND transporter periplasmic adaptor subunit [Ignavibacteriae bacterium HGW-Ignavibacteriae-4]|jgi:membrane fusion protein (multidrug efflux system)|nr:MAG: efflux RND transporter periplasmic adaptor subunit [Ignavibacteriae bacterium HGW-Ignavibacteriae-4]
MKIIKFIIGALAIVSLYSCQSEAHSESEHHKDKSKYVVTSPMKADTTIIKDYVCQVHSIQHIELRALERGYLQKIYVDEGQAVKKGQLMFQILPNLYNAELKKAEAEANYANIEYKNTKSLADSNIVSKNELALTKAKYEKAQAELQLAKVHLGFTEIRAPFDGIMGRFQVREGSLLDEGELLSTLSDNSEMWTYFNVPEAEYLEYTSKERLNKSLEVELLMANQKLYDHIGIVKVIEADFNNETGNIAFRATFPNPKGLLRHGETGNIQIKMQFANSLIIPQKATFEVLEKKFVYVVGKDNKLKAREIKIAEELPHLYILKGGLAENDKILLEGLNKVKANQKIAFNFLKPRKAVSSLELYAE